MRAKIRSLFKSRKLFFLQKSTGGPGGNGGLLMEDSGYLLLEDGTYILLE